MAENADLLKSVEYAHKEIEKLKSSLDKCRSDNADFDRRLTLIEEENKSLKAYAEELEDYILTLDSATRKRNFIITGLAETGDESSDSLILLVYNFLQPFLETIDISDFDCAYRLGKKGGNSRPILCKMVKESIRNDICSIRNSLYDEDSEVKVYLNDDLPQLMIERKAAFRMIVKLAKSKKIPASASNSKLTVNNVTYSHKNLDCFPEGCRPEDAKILKVKGGLAFQSKYAWLSNFYPCKLEIQGQRFVSAEQAYQFTKASRLGDSHLATMIIRTNKPQEAKKLGAGLEFNPKWDTQKIDVMRTIVNEKFMQNPNLTEKLVGTGGDSLIEATLDKFWAANATLTSKSLKKGTWQGANFLGKILMETRTEIRRELGMDINPTPMQQSNAPSSATALPLPQPPTHPGSAGGNHGPKVNKPYPANVDSAAAKQVVNSSQAPQPTPGRGKKNKEHQSPIKSPNPATYSSTASQQKKARVFSPKSALPPRVPMTGDLFSCPPISEEPIVSSVV